MARAFRQHLSLLLCLCSICSLLPQRLRAADDVDFDAEVRPFLRAHCYECHGASEQSGDRRFDTLDAAIQDDNALIDWQDILDQLNLGAMPPAEAEQPSDEERLRIIERLTERIADFHRRQASTRPAPRLRRLNAREYQNTVSDLLRLNVLMFDPTEEFPKDQTAEHLDNVGSELVISGYLLDKYLKAADLVIDKALYPLVQPEVQSWRFEDDLRQQPEIDQVHGKTNEFSHLTLYDVVGADKHEGAYAPIHEFARGVPHDGWYELRFQAEALNRLHPYDDDFLGTDRDELLRLGIVAGNAAAGPLHKPQPIEPLLAELELEDGQHEYEVRVWLDRGFTPRFTFRNGLMDARNLWSQVLRRYPELFPDVPTQGIVQARFAAIAYGKLPQIHVDNIEISGPYYDEWPRASQSMLLGEDWAGEAEPSFTEEQLRERLRHFAERAFRRPVQATEVDRLVDFVEQRQASGESQLRALADGFKLILCSPSFLYLRSGSDKEDAAPQFMLASRLSYFLWSSMPDARLLELAAAGELQRPEVLAAEVERMLGHPKSDAFIRDFLDSWLTLRDFGASPPDRNAFRNYYHYDLGAAMLRESELFVRHLIDENLPLETFIDSDFTFVNKRLAAHYGIDPPVGHRFERVELEDDRRGGLLGQASVLTVTANGIDTSPVVRGVWVLENLLGTPPSPPPPDVEPLDPDVRGAKTIRDQLEKHRNTPSCNSCHRKIDPLGFALENFDPIGGWRDSYGKSSPVDASGELPSGVAFQDIRGLKEALLEQQELFDRALAGKLLAYSQGRLLQPSDRPQVDRILQQTREEGGGLRDLIHQVALAATAVASN